MNLMGTIRKLQILLQSTKPRNLYQKGKTFGAIRCPRDKQNRKTKKSKSALKSGENEVIASKESRYKVVDKKLITMGEDNLLGGSMINKRAYYEQVMADFNKRYGLTEKEFLRLYNLQGEELKKAEEGLSEELKAALIHLKVAYGLMVKQQK